MLEGYNGTILTYGQTGTGKTYTMIGEDEERRGIIPRALEEIFTHIEQDINYCYDVQIGFVQIYMEMLQDLLNVEEESSYVRIRENPGQGVFLSNLSWWPVSNVIRCMELLYLGDSNRNTAFTNMNAHSSRSHAIYMVKLQKRRRYSQEEIETIEKEGKSFDNGLITSTLYLVDLAGSERSKKTKATGIRFDESKTINLALLALGNVIHALADKNSKYVPYRDSKLTRILEASLGGNCKTSLIVTVGPCLNHVSETISSLQFGSRAMKVVTRPKINVEIDYKALCAQLQSELDKANDGYSIANIERQKLIERVKSLEIELDQITKERSLYSIKKPSKTKSVDIGTITERTLTIDKGIQAKCYENPFENVKILNQDADFKISHKNDKSNDESVLPCYQLEIEKIIKECEETVAQKESQHIKYLEDLDEHIYRQEEEMAHLKYEIDTLRNNNALLTQEILQHNQQCECERSELITKIEELKTKCVNLKEGYQEEIDTLTNQNDSLKEELESTQLQLPEFTLKISELENALELLEKQDSEEINRLVCENEDFKIELENTKLRYQREIEVYRTGFDSSKSSIVEVSSCSDSLENKERLTKCSAISSAVIFNDKFEKAARFIQRFYRTKKTQIITRKALIAQAVRFI